MATEFAVVVLGVLAALAADEWRQDAADAAAAQFFRDALVDDLRSDSVLFAEAYSTALSQVAGARYLEGVSEATDSHLDSVGVAQALKNLVGSNVTVTSRSSSFDALLASARLDLLDLETRRVLAAHREQIGRIQSTVQVSQAPIYLDAPGSVLTTAVSDAISQAHASFRGGGRFGPWQVDHEVFVAALRSEPAAVDWLRRRRLAGEDAATALLLMLQRTATTLRSLEGVGQ